CRQFVPFRADLRQRGARRGRCGRLTPHRQSRPEPARRRPEQAPAAVAEAAVAWAWALAGAVVGLWAGLRRGLDSGRRDGENPRLRLSFLSVVSRQLSVVLPAATDN